MIIGDRAQHDLPSAKTESYLSKNTRQLTPDTLQGTIL